MLQPRPIINQHLRGGRIQASALKQKNEKNKKPQNFPGDTQVRLG